MMVERCTYPEMACLDTKYGTPFYLFDRGTLAERCRQLRAVPGFGTAWRPFYMAKANWLPEALQVICQQGLGVVITNEYELGVCTRAGFSPDRIIVVGPAKPDRLLRTCVREGVYMVLVESAGEAEQLSSLSREHGRTMRVGCRCSLGLRAHRSPVLFEWATRGSTGKFGWERDEVLQAVQRIAALPNLELCAVATNIGTQVCSLSAFSQAIDELAWLADKMDDLGAAVTHIDVGGGLADATLSRRYPHAIGRLAEVLFGRSIGPQREELPRECHASELLPHLVSRLQRHRKGLLLVEPGRWVVSNSMVLVCKVLRVSIRRGQSWLYLDGGIDVLPEAGFGEKRPFQLVGRHVPGQSMRCYSIGGPLCLKADVLARSVQLPAEIREGDFIIIGSAGAYGLSRGSWFGGRLPPVVEVGADLRDSRLIWEATIPGATQAARSATGA